MEELSHHVVQSKKRKQGPKKDFLSRLSVDSDSGSDLLSADRCSLSVRSNQSAKSQSILSGQSLENQSARFQSVDGQLSGQLASLENQSERSWFRSGSNQSARIMSADGQSDSLILTRSNQAVINQSLDQNNQSTRKQFIDLQSHGDNQSAKVHYIGRSDQSVESPSREDERPFLSGNYQSARGQTTGESNDCVRNDTAQNQSVINNLQNRNNQFARNKSLIGQNQSEISESGDSRSKSSLDVLASVAAPKRQKADSLSLMSLPEDLHFSFSEIEDGSLQLDDIDLTCSPSADDTISSGIDQNKCLVEDRDLQRISALISSSSDQNEAQKMGVSEGYIRDGVSSARRDRDVVVKSENSGDNSGVTWDDILSWGVNAHQVSTVGSSAEVLPKKKTISPRRSSKNKHMENVSCQVCGDVAAGFYCGAFICEACKKFYMRAYKQDKLKYVCLRDKKCVITRESRVQCQYCRFQKCVGLNMYIPKQGEGETNDSQMSHIPCRVCLAPSSGFHFGAITCEGCKGFFRRMAKEREPEKYQCNKKGKCEINMVTRNLCKACRYTSCLHAGMSVEGSRIGRQPNSVKHAISMELKMVKTDPADTDVSITKVKEEPIDSDVDFLKDADKSDEFSFWNTDNLVSQNQTSRHGSSSDNPLISSPGSSGNQPCFDSITRPDTCVIPEEILMISESSQHALSLTHKPQVTSGNRLVKANISQESFVSKGGQMMNTLPCVSVGGASGRQAIIHQPQMSISGSNRGLATTPQLPMSIGSLNERLSTISTAHVSMGNSNEGLTTIPQSRMSMGNSNEGFSMIPQPHVSMGNSNEGFSTIPQPRVSMGNSNEGFSTIPQPRVSMGNSNEGFSMIPQPRVSMGNSDGGLTTIPQPCVSIGGSKWGLSTIPQPRISEIRKTPTRDVFTFTPSPVSQFLSNTPVVQKTIDTNSGRPPRDTIMNLNVNQGVNMSSQITIRTESASQLAQYSPSMLAPQMTATNQLNLPLPTEADQDMKEAVDKIIEAGKCLQLLNYRVFDTDVNPTTSMNVDDIKALFKSKYMDPRAGNHITSKVDMSIFSSRESTWNYMMTNFHHNTYITIRFAKLVPGFSTLSLNDRVKLIQSSIYPIELLNMSKVYDSATKKYNYFTYTKEEENVMMEQFPMLRVFQEHFLHIGEMVTSFQFTDEEFAILSALLLFPAEISGLEDPKAVERLQFHISAALQFYEEGKFADGLTRYGILLVRVAELVQCLLQHNLAIGLLLTHNPSIKVPQLFHELIIESIKEEQKT